MAEILFFGFKLVVATILGALIGGERQLSSYGKNAGMRTDALVSLGACLFVSLGMLIPNADQTRIVAQIVSGIGFLGAGLLMREGFNVKGINTAATLWCAGAIGSLSGFGFYEYAAIGTIFVISINIFLKKMAFMLMDKAPKGNTFQMFTMEVICKQNINISSILERVLEQLGVNDVKISEIKTEANQADFHQKIIIKLNTTFAAYEEIDEIAEKLGKEDGFIAINWHKNIEAKNIETS